ncbi:polysaccharide lyase family 4 protein [Xylaria bambusicola]|uniref:polysaccharide lyase family 4 protein n=1 Tax=Xylaria bambusicola TaxID=326684 RepID=UPI0020083DBE|nr:polysaccharide lyase family 4 protein [Xylaria bambusicola]KAI0506931.1 polysaccharide lyase family 4 protein [Xylaria bambusicola]
MLWPTFFSFLFAWAGVVRGITVTSSSASYVVDTASSYNFIVTISRSTCDITSLRFYGTEYQYQRTGSHIASGLGSGTSVSYTTSPSGDTVIFACTQRSSSFDLTHYMVFRNGAANIWMGTSINQEPSIGELRYIFRLTGLSAAYPYGEVSNTAGGSAIEGSDVYNVNGQTRSKFYSSERFIDEKVYCATDSGATVHACWVRPNHQATEKSSGGPFFRDISLNNGGDYQSVTYYMNSGHVPTESFRTGFHGPYVFSMTRSGIPSASSIDVSFFDSLNLQNYVPISGRRGYIKGTATGVSSSFPIVVHWYNNNYQFWVYASSSGAYTSPPMPAGSYTMKLYQDEFLAATQTISVTAGSTVTSNIAATAVALTGSRNTIFKMGDYDGQPTGFLNAANQLRMHPSDRRMSNWSPGTVASTAASSWPMAMFKSVNNGQKISFSLPSAVSATATLRIATTLSFAGGRPQAIVNSYTCPAPAAPAKIDSRGVTRGAYRGYGEIYECSIPAGNLRSGSNTITINVVSGSSGDAFLSPNVVFDAIELFY